MSRAERVVRAGEAPAEVHAGAGPVEAERHRGIEGATRDHSRAVATNTNYNSDCTTVDLLLATQSAASGRVGRRAVQEHKSEDGGPQYNIKGTRAVLEGQETGTGDPVSILRSQLKQRGLEDESSARWMLPIFMHDDFQTDSMMPIFFSPSELTRGWIASGRPVDEAPEQPLMMDIRMLMLAMQQDSALRAKAQLVPTQEAYEAAKQIQAAVQEGE